MKKPSMELSANEKLEVFAGALLTAGIISVAYLLAHYLLRTFLQFELSSPFLRDIQFSIRNVPNLYRRITGFMTLAYVVLLFLITLLQTQRRLNQIRLQHILAYINYMTLGNYDERIPLKQTGPYETVAQNINALMDNIQEAISRQLESERTKDELITNIGHDIRTPLTSILGYLGLLRKEAKDLDENQQEFIQVAYTKAKTMEVLVNDLFDYTRTLESSAHMQVMDQIPLESFIQQVLADFDLKAQSKGVQLNYRIHPEDLTGSFDPEKMARVLSNLVSNGLKYGKGASHITTLVWTQAGDAHAFQDPDQLSLNLKRFETIDSWLLFEVRNNGELLPEEELEAIYERSYRGDQSRNGQEPGSGLGLSIVRNIINLHSGHTYAYIDGDELVFRAAIPQSH